MTPAPTSQTAPSVVRSDGADAKNAAGNATVTSKAMAREARVLSIDASWIRLSFSATGDPGRSARNKRRKSPPNVTVMPFVGSRLVEKQPDDQALRRLNNEQQPDYSQRRRARATTARDNE